MMETKQSKPSVAMRVLEAVKNATPPGRYERGVWCFYSVTDVADQYCTLIFLISLTQVPREVPQRLSRVW